MKFMISISLSEQFGCQNFIRSIKVIDRTGHSSKTNKLRGMSKEEHHNLEMENSQDQNQSHLVYQKFQSQQNHPI